MVKKRWLDGGSWFTCRWLCFFPTGFSCSEYGHLGWNVASALCDLPLLLPHLLKSSRPWEGGGMDYVSAGLFPPAPIHLVMAATCYSRHPLHGFSVLVPGLSLNVYQSLRAECPLCPSVPPSGDCNLTLHYYHVHWGTSSARLCLWHLSLSFPRLACPVTLIYPFVYVPMHQPFRLVCVLYRESFVEL